MRALVERSDLVLALGTRFSQEATANWGLPLPETLVQVDLDPGRFGRMFAVAEGVVSDAGLFCRALLAEAPGGRRPRRRGGGARGAAGPLGRGRRAGRRRRGRADARPFGRAP